MIGIRCSKYMAAGSVAPNNEARHFIHAPSLMAWLICRDLSSETPELPE
jgi:hypothetical protein